MITLFFVIVVLLVFALSALFGAPYVPSLKREVVTAFEHLYQVTDTDTVVDLGSGDGIVLSEAIKLGARAYGYEINPFLVILSKLRLGRKATIRLADMWTAKLPKDTTLVYVFSVSRDTKKLARYLQRQADAQKISFTVMMFGAKLPGLLAVKEFRGHSLYRFTPTR